ncbi:MAG: helix-hairpin-helix domain-containing protein [Candidatus Eisenbacteria bacterium]
MVFTSGERRLLALLVIFLAAGYLITGLRKAGLIEPGGEGGGAVALEEAPGPWMAEGEQQRVDEMAAGEAGPPLADVGHEQAPQVAGWLSALPAESLFVDGFLDLNRADSAALVALPGIGPALAGRILALRKERGGFRSLEDLDAVRGVGPERLKRLSALVTLGSAQAPGSP